MLANYKQPNTGLPFGRGFIIDQNGKVAYPYFGYYPKIVIEKIYELLNTTQVNEEIIFIPNRFELEQNYPNPFNSITEIQFYIPVSGQVSLKVYDVLGRTVKTLIDKKLPAGFHKSFFDGKELASGVYLYVLKTAGYVSTKKCLLMK